MTFPPLMPLLIAIWNLVWPSGVYAGVWVNVIVAEASVVVLLALGRRLAASDAPGILSAAALLGTPWYLEQVMGGRSAPIAVLCILAAMLLLHRLLTGASVAGAAAAAGVAAGLAVEARFDLLLPTVVMGTLVAIVLARTRRAPRDWLAFGVAYGAGLAVALVPWIAHSTMRVGVPFASDNLRKAWTAGSIDVRQFVPFPETLITFSSAPAGWVVEKTAGAWLVVRALGAALAVSPIPVLLIAWIRRRPAGSRLPRETAIVLAVGCLALSTQLLSMVVTGYVEVRYWIPLASWATVTAATLAFQGRVLPQPNASVAVMFVPAQVVLLLAADGEYPPRASLVCAAVWVLATVAVLAFDRYRRGDPPPAVARAAAAAAIVVPVLAMGAGSAIASTSAGTRYGFGADATTRTLAWQSRIVDALGGEEDRSRVRILVPPVDERPFPSEFGARTGIPSVIKPTAPFGWIDLWLFVHRYGITHVVAGDRELDERLPILFAVTKSANGAIWRIDGDRPGAVVAGPASADEVPDHDGLALVTNVSGPIAAAGGQAQPGAELRYPLLFVPR